MTMKQILFFLLLFLAFPIGCVTQKDATIRMNAEHKYAELSRLENAFNPALYSTYKETAKQMPPGLVLFGHDEAMFSTVSAIRSFRNFSGSLKTEKMVNALREKYGINEAFIFGIKDLPPDGHVYSLEDNEYLFWKYGANFKH